MTGNNALQQIEQYIEQCPTEQLEQLWIQLIDEFCTNTVTFAYLWKKSTEPEFHQLKKNLYYSEVPDIYAPIEHTMKELRQMKWLEIDTLLNSEKTATYKEELCQLILSMVDFRLQNIEAEQVQQTLLQRAKSAHQRPLVVEDEVLRQLLRAGEQLRTKMKLT